MKIRTKHRLHDADHAAIELAVRNHIQQSTETTDALWESNAKLMNRVRNMENIVNDLTETVIVLSLAFRQPIERDLRTIMEELDEDEYNALQARADKIRAMITTTVTTTTATPVINNMVIKTTKKRQLSSATKSASKLKWTPKDNATLIRMRKKHATWDEIGTALSRSPHACETQFYKIRNR